LGWIGQKPVESPFIEVGMYATNFYFLFMLVLVPLIGLFEKYALEMGEFDKPHYEEQKCKTFSDHLRDFYEMIERIELHPYCILRCKDSIKF
jgi:hypothetical protein